MGGDPAPFAPAFSSQMLLPRVRSDTVVTPGYKLPVKGLDWTIVTAAGKIIDHPLPGAGQPNPACANFKQEDVDTTENARSAGRAHPSSR